MLKMSRKKNLLINSIIGLLSQIVTLSCGFIIPRFMITYYGSATNGLVSSVTHFLGFISFLEMGVGSVVRANLYKPLAGRDEEQISMIAKAASRFFKRIGIVFLVYICVLIFIFPKYINSEFEPFFSRSLILVISLSTLAQYFLGITYQLILDADQKVYVNQLLNVATLILNTLIAVILMKRGLPIQIVKLCSSLVFIIRALLLCFFVTHHYGLKRNVEYKVEPLKQKWNGFSQHFASVINLNVDAAVLTLFSTLSNLSVYSIYYAVVNGINGMINATLIGFEAFFGSVIARDENDFLKESFSCIQVFIHGIVTVIFTITLIMIVPFVEVYTYGFTDTEYIIPIFGFILSMAYAIECIRIPYFLLIKAAGHFRETQVGIFISAIINIIFSVVLVINYGLAGTAMGTLASAVFSLLYCVFYLHRHIVYLELKSLIKTFLVDIAILVVVIFICNKLSISMIQITYYGWIIMGIKVTIIAFIVAFVFNLIFQGTRWKQIFLLLRRKT
ncbi:MAG: sugar isomerase [Lachnospiraceae bacterium]|jgi:Na+-driven multidrug efflux pump|nr:sugar isomerase [Lachnospiraceae bacterium]